MSFLAFWPCPALMYFSLVVSLQCALVAILLIQSHCIIILIVLKLNSVRFSIKLDV